MNTNVEGSWNQIRSEVKRRWNKLSENDIDNVTGELDKLVGLIQDKYGYSRKKAEEQVDRFMSKYGDDMQDTAAGMGGNVKDFVERYPWSVALAVLLVGLVVGLLVLRPNMQNEMPDNMQSFNRSF